MKYEILAFNPFNNLMTFVRFSRSLRQAKKFCTEASKQNQIDRGSKFAQVWRLSDDKLVYEIA